MSRGLALLAVLAAIPPSLSRADQVVTVLAAASLTDAFRAAGERFQALHPGVRIELDFAGTPTLVAQVERGAPADVFAAADEASMQRLEQGGFLSGTASVFARNRLAIAVGAGNPKRIARLADLARPGLVVALCAPAVPAGRYATEAFARAGVAVPEASREVDVRAVLTRVTLGEADAGIVYATDIRTAGDKVAAIDIPEARDIVARYPIAVLKDARDRRDAEDFVAFVLSPAGQEILKRFGFLGR